MPDDVQLPAVTHATTTNLEQLTAAMNVPRDLLPSDERINAAWSQLPRLLSEIPEEYRTEHHVRMCVAVASGLFDSAINYAWNAAVLRLRDRVRAFGLNVVRDFTGKSFDETTLVNLKDAELLELCLQLNLLTEEGFFFLDQCRDTRNNFSSAHPAMGQIDDIEFVSFVNRCTKHALADTANPQGVDSSAFLGALKAERFTGEQTLAWSERLRRTHDAQRELLFGTLHGVFCDPQSSQETRLNAIDVCKEIAGELSSSATSRALNQHSEYVAAGDTERHTASRAFFEQLGSLDLLSGTEQHAIISAASRKLLTVHQGFDNFYNEPPFAERLLQITQATSVPASAQQEFVDAVLTCAVGNQYGLSWGATDSYEAMIKNFSPREVRLMLQAPQRNTILAQRLRQHTRCRRRFVQLVELLDPESIGAPDKALYDRALVGNF